MASVAGDWNPSIAFPPLFLLPAPKACRDCDDGDIRNLEEADPFAVDQFDHRAAADALSSPSTLFADDANDVAAVAVVAVHG